MDVRIQITKREHDGYVDYFGKSDDLFGLFLLNRNRDQLIEDAKEIAWWLLFYNQGILTTESINIICGEQ